MSILGVSSQNPQIFLGTVVPPRVYAGAQGLGRFSRGQVLIVKCGSPHMLPQTLPEVQLCLLFLLSLCFLGTMMWLLYSISSLLWWTETFELASPKKFFLLYFDFWGI